MTQVRTVDGYRLLVPREWQKIPVQRGTDRAIAGVLDQAFARFGRDQVAQYRRELEQRLKSAIAKARDNGGVDVYLPVGNRERNLPATFMVSFAEFGSVTAPDAALVLDEVLTSSPNGAPVVLDGARGLRAERVYDPDPERGVDQASRRVEYIVPVPGSADSWLVSSFSTFGDGNPEDDTAMLLCSLFDAIMSTFRWKYREEDV